MHITKPFLTVCAAVCCVAPASLYGDTNAQIKAQQELERKMNELEGRPTQAKPPRSAPVKPASAEDISKARSAAQQKLNELQGQPVQPQMPPPVAKPAPAA